MGTKNQGAVYEWVNISGDLVYEWVRFFKGQVYDWGRFQNIGSNTRTTITPKLPRSPSPPPPPPPPLPPTCTIWPDHADKLINAELYMPFLLAYTYLNQTRTFPTLLFCRIYARKIWGWRVMWWNPHKSIPNTYRVIETLCFCSFASH